MSPDEFKALALAHLDKCDEADREEWATEQPDADWFADAHERWGHARAAFSGMGWEEFCQLDAARNRKGRRGRPRHSRAHDKLWLAACDAARIKALWKRLHPSTPRPRPPIHPHDLAAARHGVSRQSLDDRAGRPKARRPDRNTARK